MGRVDVAACEDAGCDQWLTGWDTVCDLTAYDGRMVAELIRSGRTARTYRELGHAPDATVVVFRFDSGQRCFREHRTAEPEEKAPPTRKLGTLEQHFLQLFGVADPAVLLPPGPTVWETDREWWHGGVGGLEPGELILPWDQVGAVPYFGGGSGGRGGASDVPGACWVSTDKMWARFYASTIPDGGDLYRVRPRGLIVDTEHPPPDSWLFTLGVRFRAGCLVTMGLLGNQACIAAEILEVAERAVPRLPYNTRLGAGGSSVVPALPKDKPALVHRTARAMPLPPPRDPAGPYRICCVCHGNICRSPTAETVLRDQLERAGLGERVTVDSAGTWAERGKPMDPPARALLRRRGYGDGEAHRGRQFDVSWLAERDLVLAMDASNLAALRAAAAPADHDRIRLFGEIAGLGGAQVPNPWHGTDADFARVLAMIETGSAAIVGQLAATAAEGATPA